MPISPNKTEEKIRSTINTWETLRPEKSFGGMTLAQFKAKIEPSLSARATLNQLTDQVQAAIGGREKADKESNALINLVINAVKGDPDEGDDGEFYKAMGYVRKSERKSGLSRKAKTSVESVTRRAA